MQPSSSAQVRYESCKFSKELDLDCVVTRDFGLEEAVDSISLEASLCVSAALLH